MSDPLPINADEAIAHYNDVKAAVETLKPILAYRLLVAIIQGHNLNDQPESAKIAAFITNEGRPNTPHLEGLLREHFQAYLQRNQAQRDAHRAARQSPTTGE